MEQPLVFKTYPDKASADEVLALLKEKGIIAEVAEEARILDSNYIGQRYSDPWLIYLKGDDFERAHEVLEDSVVVNLDEVDPGYMLLSFTNEELIDVMKKRDEWGDYNCKLAEALLKQRNADVPEVQIAIEQVTRLQEKEKAVSSGIMFLLTGYFTLLSGITLMLMYGGNGAFMLFPGGLGLFIGWHLSHSKRTLHNGRLAFYFNDSTRLQGSIIFWGGLSVAIVRVLLLLMKVILE